MISAARSEAAKHPGIPKMIAGDLNAKLERLEEATELLTQEGWIDEGRNSGPTCLNGNGGKMTRIDYALACPLMQQKVGRVQVSYSSIFAVHHILQFEIIPDAEPVHVDRLCNHTGLAMSFEEKLMKDTEGMTDKERHKAREKAKEELQNHIDGHVTIVDDILDHHKDNDDTNALWSTLGRAIEEGYAAYLGITPKQKREYRSITGRGKPKTTPKLQENYKDAGYDNTNPTSRYEGAEAHRSNMQAKRCRHLARGGTDDRETHITEHSTMRLCMLFAKTLGKLTLKSILTIF